MNTAKKDLYRLSQPEVYIFVTNHLGKILFLSLLTIFIVSVIDKNDYDSIKRISHIILVFTTIGLIIDRLLRKVALKIRIDYTENKISFYMCRTKETKNYNLNSIEDIALNFYTKFTFENEVILCNFVKDKTFMNNIIKLKRINNLK